MTENVVEPRKLTLQDPVDAQTLGLIEKMQNMRVQLAERLLDLEQEKIRTLRAASNLDVERSRVFEEINVARGLAPGAPVEIDAKTGVVKLMGQATAASEDVPPAEVEPT